MVVRGCQWVCKPPISPTPSPGHHQVTFGRRYEKYVGKSTLDKLIELVSRSHCDTLIEEYGLDKQASYYELGKMGPSPGTNGTARRRLSRNLLASTSRSRAAWPVEDGVGHDGCISRAYLQGQVVAQSYWHRQVHQLQGSLPYAHQRVVGAPVPTACPYLTVSRTRTVTRGRRCMLSL